MSRKPAMSCALISCVGCGAGGLSGTPASFLSALSAGMQVGTGLPTGLPSPVTQADSTLAKALEGRRLQFASPSGPALPQHLHPGIDVPARTTCTIILDAKGKGTRQVGMQCSISQGWPSACCAARCGTH